MDQLNPDFVDIHVGQAIRRRRLELGQSQTQLGQALGISFQQVQKYERAANRISASMIYKAAKAQGVAPSYYFAGLPQLETTEADDRAKEVRSWLSSRDAWTFAEAIVHVPHAARLSLLRLLRDMRVASGSSGTAAEHDDAGASASQDPVDLQGDERP